MMVDRCDSEVGLDGMTGVARGLKIAGSSGTSSWKDRNEVAEWLVSRSRMEVPGVRRPVHIVNRDDRPELRSPNLSKVLGVVDLQTEPGKTNGLCGVRSRWIGIPGWPGSQATATRGDIARGPPNP